MLDRLLTDHSRLWRVMGILSAAFLSYAIYLTDSRNAWVSAALGCSVLGLAHAVGSRQRFVASVASSAVVLLAILFALIANETTREWVLPRGDSFRPEIWAAAVDRIIDASLWLGLGIGTSDDFIIDGVRFLHAHNMYLSVTYQGGVVGLALFAYVIFRAIKALLMNYDSHDAKLALAILAIALNAYLLDGHELLDKIGADWLLFWLPVAVALGLEWSRPKHL
jgi:O-antigen ligase